VSTKPRAPPPAAPQPPTPIAPGDAAARRRALMARARAKLGETEVVPEAERNDVLDLVRDEATPSDE